MPAGIGYGKRARGRGRGGGGLRRLPSGSLPRQGQIPQRGAGRGKGQGAMRGKGVGIGQAGMPGPGGAQLSRRVSSGAITPEQAQKTMQQRQTLRKAFGEDWRTRVFGARGAMQSARVGLAKNPKNPRFAALNKKLLERRSQMLAAARKRNKGEGEDEE